MTNNSPSQGSTPDLKSAIADSARSKKVALTVVIWVALAAWAATLAIGLVRWINPIPAPWIATFFGNENLQPPVKYGSRFYELNFLWSPGSPHPTLQPNYFSARFETCLKIPEPKEVKFILGSDDGSRLILDGEPIINLWSPHVWGRSETTVPLKGGSHSLKVEYFQLQGVSQLEVKVLTIPSNQELGLEYFAPPLRDHNGNLLCR